MSRQGYKYTPTEIKKIKQAYIEALYNTGGLTSQAAKMVGVGNRGTILDWRKKDEEFNAACETAIEEAREMTLDMAENALLRAIQAGDFGAIKFFLKCKGRQRGYDLRQEIDINATVSRPRVIFEDEDEDNALQD